MAGHSCPGYSTVSSTRQTHWRSVRSAFFQKGGQSTPASGWKTVGWHGPVFCRKHTVLSMARHIQVNRDWCPVIVPFSGPAQLLLPGDQKHSPKETTL